VAKQAGTIGLPLQVEVHGDADAFYQTTLRMDQEFVVERQMGG
jgi:hypothetical protein